MIPTEQELSFYTYSFPVEYFEPNLFSIGRGTSEATYTQHKRGPNPPPSSKPLGANCPSYLVFCSTHEISFIMNGEGVHETSRGGLIAAIARGEGELIALRAALSQVEAALDAERIRASKLKTTATKEAQARKQQAAQAHTLMQKVESERKVRQGVRAQLAAAALNLEASTAEIERLRNALAASEAAREVAKRGKQEQDGEVKVLRARCATLEMELGACKEVVVHGEAHFSVDLPLS